MTITKSDGTQIDKTEREACPPRFLSQFATSIGVSLVTYRKIFDDWKNKYPAFGDALKEAKELELEMIRTNGSLGLYNAAFSIFTLKNIAGWRDRSEIDHNINESLYVEYEKKSDDDIRKEIARFGRDLLQARQGIAVSATN